jgi:hypothetical protein
MILRIGDVWRFKNSLPAVYVRIFEINKIKGGTEVVYGLKKATAGHISCQVRGFIQNYELVGE